MKYLRIAFVFFLLVASVTVHAKAQPNYTPTSNVEWDFNGNNVQGNNQAVSNWFSQNSTYAGMGVVLNPTLSSNASTTVTSSGSAVIWNNITNQPVNTTPISNTGAECKNVQIKDIASLAQFIGCIISRSLIPLAFAFGLLFLTWGITMLILNAGNSEAREKGQQLMIWGLIGFFVLASVWGLVAVLLNTFQLNNKTHAPIPCFQDGTC